VSGELERLAQEADEIDCRLASIESRLKRVRDQPHMRHTKQRELLDRAADAVGLARSQVRPLMSAERREQTKY
jgi:hypothetical protein